MTDFEDQPAPEAESAAAPQTPVIQPAEQAQPQAEAPQTPAPAGKPEEPKGEHPFWYRKEIEKERKRAADLERRLQQAESARPLSHAPDPRQDPISYFEQMRVIDNVARSEDRFVDKHGEQEFEACKDWLATRPDIEAWAIQQRHPWAAAHQQYQREKLSAEIGDDPNTWREKERQRIRDELLAEMGGAAPEPGAMSAPPAPRLPPSAASARSAAPRGPIQQKSPFKTTFG